MIFFFFQAEDGIRDADVTGVQTCALPISPERPELELVGVPAPAREVGRRSAALNCRNGRRRWRRRWRGRERGRWRGRRSHRRRGWLAARHHDRLPLLRGKRRRCGFVRATAAEEED